MKKNIFPLVVLTGVVASGLAVAAAYVYKEFKAAEEESEEGINEIYGDEEDDEEEDSAETVEDAEAGDFDESEAEAAPETKFELPEDEEDLNYSEYTKNETTAIPEESEEDLESFMAEHPEEKESLEAVKESFTADGVRTDIEVSGNTMFFDFIMTDVDDEDTRAVLKPDLASFLEEQTGAYSEVVSTMEEETGIDGIKMIVIFMDANEEEIVSAHYDDEGKTL